MERLNIMLHETSAAYAQPVSERAKIREHLAAARAALADARDFLRATDTGVFTRWHESDEKFKINKLLQSFDAVIANQAVRTKALKPLAK
jgi:hypothetical protein